MTTFIRHKGCSPQLNYTITPWTRFFKHIFMTENLLQYGLTSINYNIEKKYSKISLFIRNTRLADFQPWLPSPGFSHPEKRKIMLQPLCACNFDTLCHLSFDFNFSNACWNNINKERLFVKPRWSNLIEFSLELTENSQNTTFLLTVLRVTGGARPTSFEASCNALTDFTGSVSGLMWLQTRGPGLCGSIQTQLKALHSAGSVDFAPHGYKEPPTCWPLISSRNSGTRLFCHRCKNSLIKHPLTSDARGVLRRNTDSSCRKTRFFFFFFLSLKVLLFFYSSGLPRWLTLRN